MKAGLGRNRTASLFHHLRIASERSHPPTRNIANVIPKMYQSISDTGGNRNSAEVSDMQHAPKHRTVLSRRILLRHCSTGHETKVTLRYFGLVTGPPYAARFRASKVCSEAFTAPTLRDEVGLWPTLVFGRCLAPWLLTSTVGGVYLLILGEGGAATAGRGFV